MTAYSVRRKIGAPAEVIWEILTDGPAYPRWNPTVLRLDGRIADGERIELVSTVNPKRQFKLEVTDVQPPERMVWWDGMPLGLFKGVRTFTITPTGDGTCEFHMEEVYSGLIAPLITKSIPDMTESFEQFAGGLAAEAERRAG